MPHTFDIRFARTAGLAAILEAPGNAFRWKGSGRLSIHPESITIAVKRGMTTLFAVDRSRRIEAANLKEVYREGDALRLEFTSAGAMRNVLPFWVGDAEVAAEIVRLLPTQRTVELEHRTDSSARKYRFDWRLVTWLITGVLALGIGALVLQRFLAPSAVEAPSMERAIPAVESVTLPPTEESVPIPLDAPSVAAPMVEQSPTTAPTTDIPLVSAPVELSPPDFLAPTTDMVDETPAIAPAEREAAMPNADVRSRVRVVRVATRDGVVPIVPTDAAYATARRQLDFFEAETATLRADFIYVRDSPTAEIVNAFEERWWNLSERIYLSPEFDHPAIRMQLQAELAVSRSWRMALSYYAEGVRTGDKRWTARALAEIEFAEALAARVRLYVR